MASAQNIRQHMSVLAADGARIGTVDHLDGPSIKLTRNDSDDGKHHLIPLDWVATIDDQVHLSKSADDARREWTVLN